MSKKKVSVRFYNNREVRAIWDDENNKWCFSVIDVVAALSLSSNPANYWYVLKSRRKPIFRGALNTAYLRVADFNRLLETFIT